MANPVPNRSGRGCLTCKQRKKKCDETRPACERCTNGNFQCLGYAHLDSPKPPTVRRWQRSTAQHAANSVLPLGLDLSPSSLSTQSSPELGYSSDVSFVTPNSNGISCQEQPNALTTLRFHERPIPKSLELDPLEIDNMVQLIVSQYGRLAHRIAFRPFPFSIEKALAQRAQSSSIVRWTMYIGARIAQALLDDTHWQSYVGWIDNFHRQITGTESALVAINTADLGDRLAALQDLAFYAFMVLNSSAGYTIFRKCSPLFLQLAAKYPPMWADGSAISIHHALYSQTHPIIKFVFADTIASLAFGVIPLIHYDTTVHTTDHLLGWQPFLEWVYGCPIIMIILLAKVNSSRISRLVNRDAVAPNEADIQDIENHLREWKATIDYVDQPTNLIARLAVQECWRQSVLIYMYMGMCGANSADKRVEPLVKQVVQLASTVETGSPLEIHLFIPCLIAGAAARKERHRAIIRKKIQASQKADACLLRGADFVFVLDHLWHNAASGGASTTWEDYVNSRCATLPLEI